MKNDSDSDLERLDPDSEACFDALCARISEELAARIAVGNDPTTIAGRNTLSELIADAVLDAFVVRVRVLPRYRWRKPQ
jgi:hypothetical protein